MGTFPVVKAPDGAPQRAADPDRRRRVRPGGRRSAGRSRRPPSTGWRRPACATPASTPPPSARPTRAALLTGRNHHSCGTGVITEMATGFPGYTGHDPEELRDGRGGAAAERLRTAWFGKNHNVAGLGDQPGRAVRPLADRPGLRLLLRLHRRRHRTSGSPALYENTTPVEPPQDRRAGLPLRPRTSPTTPSTGIRRSNVGRAGQAVLRLLRRRAPRTRRTTRRRSGSTSSRASSTRAGTSTARRRFARQKRARRRSRRTPS